MTWGVLNTAILVGFMGVALPLLIHLLNRRRGNVVDWGAMQFLEPGRRLRQRIKLAEILLMAARMALLGLVVLALARPFWSHKTLGATGGGLRSGSVLAVEGPPRDVVLILDVSESMGRKSSGSTVLARATDWAKTFIGRCRAGDSVAVLYSGDGVQRTLDPPTYDLAKVQLLLDATKPPMGASDLPAALADALRILERTGNPRRDVLVLSDGQRFPWRPGETGRWDLLRAVHKRLAVPPRIWAVTFTPTPSNEGLSANASIENVAISRALVTPGLPLEVTAEVRNEGPGKFSGTALLAIDQQPSPGSPQMVGPVPAGGRFPLSFHTSFEQPGSHLLAVRLAGGDALEAGHHRAVPVRVAPAIPVLFVNGEPGVEPLTGETDFLRAALAPAGDDTPQFRIKVVNGPEFRLQSLTGMKVAVLANLNRISPDQATAIGAFLAAGGGVLVAPGDRTEARSWNNVDWMPARITGASGNATDAKIIAHPAPRTFNGPLMSALGRGDTPALGEAGFLAFHKVEAKAGSAVLARLDTGEPWIVEQTQGRGRVLVFATAIDAEAGTLPVNPDFVPLMHEAILHLAGGGDNLLVRAGEPLFFPLDDALDAKIKSLEIETPGGRKAQAAVIRGVGQAQARFDDTVESGIYRLSLPGPPSGRLMYGGVIYDERESDTAPLEGAEAAKLAEGWPLEFVTDAQEARPGLFAADAGTRHEIWRLIILAALGGLCLEIYLTRRLVRVQAGAGVDAG